MISALADVVWALVVLQLWAASLLAPAVAGGSLITLAITHDTSPGNWCMAVTGLLYSLVGLSYTLYARNVIGRRPWLQCAYAGVSVFLLLFIFTPGLAPLFAVAIIVALWWLETHQIPPGHCRKCRYDLTGNTSGRCPECGTPISQPPVTSSQPRRNFFARHRTGVISAIILAVLLGALGIVYQMTDWERHASERVLLALEPLSARACAELFGRLRRGPLTAATAAEFVRRHYRAQVAGSSGPLTAWPSFAPAGSSFRVDLWIQSDLEVRSAERWNILVDGVPVSGRFLSAREDGPVQRHVFVIPKPAAGRHELTTQVIPGSWSSITPTSMPGLVGWPIQANCTIDVGE